MNSVGMVGTYTPQPNFQPRQLQQFPPRNEENPAEKKSVKPENVAVGIGLAALIYFLTRGKKGANTLLPVLNKPKTAAVLPEKISRGTLPQVNALSDTFTLSGNAVSKVTNKAKKVIMSSNDFKQAGGKMMKNHAYLANGEGYSGVITKKIKAGTCVMEYKNGKLLKASIVDKTGHVFTHTDNTATINAGTVLAA